MGSFQGRLRYLERETKDGALPSSTAELAEVGVSAPLLGLGASRCPQRPFVIHGGIASSESLQTRGIDHILVLSPTLLLASLTNYLKTLTFGYDRR